MSLYKQWTDMVVSYVKEKGEEVFWNEYTSIEEGIYRELLSKHESVVKTTVKELAANHNASVEFIMGFVDGINDSLKNPYDLEELTVDSELVLDIDLEKLYFNMLDAKADYLYNLPQWDGIFSVEKRKEIAKNHKNSLCVRNENKVGRNEPCPCGSGKKYKKCCGK